MKNWKKVSTFLLALSMSVAFSLGIAACGGEETPATSGSETSSSVDSTNSESSTDSSVDETSSDDETDSSVEGTSSDDETDSSVDETSSDDETASSSTDDGSSDDVDDGDKPVVTTQKAYTENGCTYPALQVAENYEMYSWTEFELVEEASCKAAGIKQAYWTEDESVIHQAHIAPRGHTYNNGICACGEGPVYPAAPAKITYTAVEDCSGKGQEYDRYELTEGYYEVTMPRFSETKTWLSFAVEGPGQYALYTIDTVPTGTTIIRHDASAQYINPNNFPAGKVDGNVLYSNVTCSSSHWSESWRATFSISGGKSGEVLKLRFVKIDEEPWQPKTVRVQHLAQQINGVTAEDGPEGCQPAEVPFEADFFYEESSGYYRMGTPDNVGDIIYVAITMVPERMLLDKPFTQIQYELGSNVYLDTGKTTIDGDYLIWDYMPFISGDTDNDMKIDVDNCYQNFVNSDGLYPVNQELYEFLYLYTYKNKPIGWDDTLGAWRSDEYMERAWLAACYYYKNLQPGSKDLPYEIESIGDVEIKTTAEAWTYYSLSHTNYSSQSTITYCTVSCEDENALIRINDGAPIAAPFSILVETSAPFVFSVISSTFAEETFTFKIVDEYAGSQDDPEAVTITKGTQTVEINSIEHMKVNGTVEHLKYYTFNVSESGTLSLSADKNALVTITYTDTDNTQKTVLLSEWNDIEVKAGDVLEIVVGPADKAIDFDLTVSLT